MFFFIKYIGQIKWTGILLYIYIYIYIIIIYIINSYYKLGKDLSLNLKFLTLILVYLTFNELTMGLINIFIIKILLYLIIV